VNNENQLNSLISSMNDNISLRSEVVSSNGDASLRSNSRMSFKKLGI